MCLDYKSYQYHTCSNDTSNHRKELNLSSTTLPSLAMPTRTSSSHSTLSPLTQRTPLLQHSISNQSARSGRSYHRPSCQQEECEHGLLSPHASRPTSSDSNKPTQTSFNGDNAQESTYTPTHLGYEPQHTESGNGSAFGGRHSGETDIRHGILGDALADGVFGSGEGGQLDGASDGKSGRGEGDEGPMSTTQWLARRHGVKGRRIMYVLFPKFRPIVLKETYWSLRAKVSIITDCMYLTQVSSILLSLPSMDNPIQMVIPPRRPHRCAYHGILLHTHVPILRL